MNKLQFACSYRKSSPPFRLEFSLAVLDNLIFIHLLVWDAAMYFYSEPVEISGEIHFRITDYKMDRFNFVVTRTAIENTCITRGRRRTDFNHMEAYRKIEDRIHSLATRMIEAGVRADPIFITTELLNR